MGLFKSKPPPPPDYAALAEKQGEANIDAARIAGRLNNPNYITPLGSRTVVFGGGGGEFDQAGYNAAMERYRRELANFQPVTRVGLGQVYNTPPTPPNEAEFYRQDDFTGAGVGAYDQPTVIEQLSPEGQRLFDQQMRISQQFGDIAEGGLGRLSNALGTPFDVSGMPTVQDINSDIFAQSVSPDVAVREKVEQALLDRLNPQLEEARRQREEALIMQGQGRGGRAWQTEQEDLSRRESDALLSAILGAGQEQSRLYNMELAGLQAQRQAEQARYGLEEANRNRALQEALMIRNLPLSEINALRTGSQPTIPQFQAYQGQTVGPAPIMQAGQAGYQAQLDAVNAQNAQTGSTFGALASLGGAALAAGGAAGGFGNLFNFGGAPVSGASYFGGIG